MLDSFSNVGEEICDMPAFMEFGKCVVGMFGDWGEVGVWDLKVGRYVGKYQS